MWYITFYILVLFSCINTLEFPSRIAQFRTQWSTFSHFSICWLNILNTVFPPNFMYPINKASNRFSGIIWLGSPLHMDFIYLFGCQGKAPSAVLWAMTCCSLSSCFPLSALSVHTLITLESCSAKWCAFSWMTMLTALFIFLVLGIKSRASWVSEKCSALH